MDLSTELRKRLLIDCGICVAEACDRCGTLVGPIRFTRIEDSGVWCSRECRGDGERRVIRRGWTTEEISDSGAGASCKNEIAAATQKTVSMKQKPPRKLRQPKE
jgi:hypothetical protein